MPKAEEKPRVVIVPQTHAFGLVRMFQLTGEKTHPLFSAVKTMDEALKVLRASTADFKPIEF